jgi:hypothetical protein
VDADGLVAQRLVGLAVGGEKQPRRLPSLPPLGLGERHLATVQGVTALGKPAATAAHRHLARRDPHLDLGKAGFQHLQAALLLEPLVLAGVAAHAATAPTHRDRKPSADLAAGAV